MPALIVKWSPGLGGKRFWLVYVLGALVKRGKQVLTHFGRLTVASIAYGMYGMLQNVISKHKIQAAFMQNWMRSATKRAKSRRIYGRLEAVVGGWRGGQNMKGAYA